MPLEQFFYFNLLYINYIQSLFLLYMFVPFVPFELKMTRVISRAHESK